MNVFVKNKKALLFAFLVLVLLFVFLYLAYLSINSLNTHNNQTKSSEEVSKEMKEYFKLDEATHPLSTEISNMIEVSPYSGKYFTFVYDENEGLFYYYLDPANKDMGNKELNQFLKQNGIPDRKFFTNLLESSVPLPTPES